MERKVLHDPTYPLGNKTQKPGQAGRGLKQHLVPWWKQPIRQHSQKCLPPPS